MNEPTTAEIQLLTEAVKHYRLLLEQMAPDKAIAHASQRFGLGRETILLEHGREALLKLSDEMAG